MSRYIMEHIKNIVIVGGVDDNPAKFITELNPIKLEKNCEMALTSLYHGRVLNINDTNNKVWFKESVESSLPDLNDEIQEPYGKLHFIEIPIGSYGSSFQIISFISSEIKKTVKRGRRNKDPMEVEYKAESDVVSVSLNEIFLLVKSYDDTPWNLLGLHEDQNKKFSLPNIHFDEKIFPAFVYASIVENSYINGNLSRILGVVPIKCAESYYDSSYTKYVPINIKEFSKVLIEVRDLSGGFVKFDPSSKTVITLHIRPIKG